MARIRTIKPEIWMSSDFVALDPIGKLTFIALISAADDMGRLKTDARHLTEVFVRGARVPSVQKQLDLMQELGMIVQYSVVLNHYISVCNWNSHQKVDHPSPSRIPEPPTSRESSRGLANDREDSRTDATVRSSRARGSDRSDRENEVTTPTPPADASPMAPPARGGVDTPGETGVWTPSQMADRVLELAGWWGHKTGRQPDTWSSREAGTFQRDAISIVRYHAPVDVLEHGMEAVYDGAENPPQRVNAPSLIRAADLANHEWLKGQRAPKAHREGGLRPLAEVDNAIPLPRRVG